LRVESADIGIFSTKPGQFSALFALANRNALPSPRQAPLLQERIVQAQMRAFHLHHLGFLPWGGIEAIGDLALHLTRGRLEPFECFDWCFHGAYLNLVIMNTQQLNKLYYCIYRLDYHLISSRSTVDEVS
jgi:hypothetical protein